MVVFVIPKQEHTEVYRAGTEQEEAYDGTVGIALVAVTLFLIVKIWVVVGATYETTVTCVEVFVSVTVVNVFVAEVTLLRIR